MPEPGGAMFKFGNGNVAKSLGLARTEICIREHWSPAEVSIFATLVPNLLSCPGLAALGAVIDTPCNVLEMSPIGFAVRPPATSVGHLPGNVADVGGADVLGDVGPMSKCSPRCRPSYLPH